MPHEATPSQLDRIAEVNARSDRQVRGSYGRWLVVAAIVAALLALAYRWQRDRPEERLPVRAPQAAATPQVAAVPPRAASALALEPAAPDVTAAEPAPQAAAEPAVVAASAVAVPAVSRARQARAKQEAELRANALQQEQAQARTLAEEQDRERRGAERARELAEEAKHRVVEAAPVRAAPVPEARRNVRELCAASSNIVSELFCRSRECRKPEHQGDATCVRLREIEEAQRLGGQQ